MRLASPHCHPGLPGLPDSLLADEFDGLRPCGARPRVLCRFRVLSGEGTRTGPHVPDFVGELMNQDAVPEGRLADVGTCTAVHGEAVAAFPDDFDGTVCRAGLFAEQGGEAGGMGVRTATRGRSLVRANSAAAWSATSLPCSSVMT